MTFIGTTILSVRRNNQTVIGGDGQVTLGTIAMKSNAKKVRRLYNDKVIVGFAGSTADSFTLFEYFEGKLQSYSGNLMKSAVEMAKDWRSDKALRRLEAMMIVADLEKQLLISGNGDVIEPENSCIAIGSGGAYAHSAAVALFKNTDLSAKEIVEKSLEISGQLCIYSNNQLTIETLE